MSFLDAPVKFSDKRFQAAAIGDFPLPLQWIIARTSRETAPAIGIA
jgi:hypothetical protein